MTGPTIDEPASKVDRFLFAPQSTAPMTLVRVLWGAMAALWALSLLPDIDPFFTTGNLRYEDQLGKGSWNLLDHIGWSGAPAAACLMLVLAGALTMVGWRTRASSFAAALLMLSLQRTNVHVFNSGDLLLKLIGISVMLSPCGLLWSLDARRRQRRDEQVDLQRAPWALRLLQLQVALGYALSAWAKLRGTAWNNGTAIALALRLEDLDRFQAPEWLFNQSIILNLFTWATLLFEASFIFLVWNRRLRPWVLGAGVLLHLGIDVFLDIGWFSYAIFLSYVAFIPPDIADRLVAKVQRTLRREGRPAPALPGPP
jgi:hypothetical protein